jgi:pimeloyl-ACP methyl ester carboxylesterase
MPEVVVNKISMNYRAAGNGHPVLLIADAGYGGWFWSKITAALAQRYQVLTPDPRGTGLTDKTEGPYTIEMLGQDMADFVDALHSRGVFVVGHGLGAYVAMHMALTRPDQVGKLVIAAGDFGGPNAVPMTSEAQEIFTHQGESLFEQTERAIAIATAPGFAQRQPQVARELLAYRMSDEAPAETIEAQLAVRTELATPEASFEEHLARIKVPTLILFGEHDRIAPPQNAQLLAAKLPNASIVILPNTGHLFPIEDPEATSKALTDFLGGSKYLP